MSDQSKATIRFLIGGAAAGSIIGKGGSSITEFQNQSGTKMQVSRNNEYFPGTQERILTMTGTVNAILTALHLILSKLRAEDIAGEKAARGEEVRLLVPNQLCGALIGRSGETIRNFINDSQASIKVSNVEEMPFGAADRIVKIMGSLDQILRAVALIVTKLKEDDRFEQLSSQTPYFRTSASVPEGLRLAQGSPTSNGRGAAALPGTPGSGGSVGPAGAPAVGPRNAPNVVSVSIGVPDEVVGQIIGRQGRGMKELQAMLGVQIAASQRDEFMPGTHDRKFTITGPVERVKYAEMILGSKIAEEVAKRRAESEAPAGPGSPGGEGLSHGHGAESTAEAH